MRGRFLFLGVLGLVVGCGDPPDTDGDGINDLKEEYLGTDPENPDTDGDGLTDAEEVRETLTDPLQADGDGDGLDDPDELELGTDPWRADSDSDGLPDGTEVDAGSDPLDVNSWPGNGIWPDRSAFQAEQGSVYDWDEVIPDFTAIDQYGEDFSLYQLSGYVVLLDFSAGWCGPCRQAASQAEDLFQAHKAEGFVIVHAMVDDNSANGKVGDEDFTAEWAEDYGLSFPVLYGDGVSETSSGLYKAGIDEGYIPFMVLLDRQGRIVETFTGAGQEAAIERALEDYL